MTGAPTAPWLFTRRTRSSRSPRCSGCGRTCMTPPTTETRGRLERLASRELLTLEPSGISFHDLQREFLLLHTDDLALLHADLLDAYRALLPDRDALGAAATGRAVHLGPPASTTCTAPATAPPSRHWCPTWPTSRSAAFAAVRTPPESDLRQAADLYPRSRRDRLAASYLYPVGPSVRRPADARRPRRNARQPHAGRSRSGEPRQADTPASGVLLDTPVGTT